MTRYDIIRFTKMHGCGNDFALIDNRELGVLPELMAFWAKKICAPHFGVGADGLIFLENAPASLPGAAYRWHFFNADGSRAEMCGNASRCTAKLAVELGLAPREHAFGTDAGLIRAAVLDDGRVKVQLTPPKDLQTHIDLELKGQPQRAHFVNTGVPHAVVLFEDVSKVDVKELGPALRYHKRFAPAGTNANFVQWIDKTKLTLRTYERGVEAETYACGTGAAASAVIAHELGLTGPAVDVTTTGGEILTINLEDGAVFLTGQALKVFTGELYADAVGLNPR
jgi:diaminopimelate epimerase